jgi:hypothetical protein
LSEGTVKYYIKCSNFGRRTNVNDEEQSGRPSELSDNLVQNAGKKKKKL